MLDRVRDLREPSMSLARTERAGRMVRRAAAGSPAPWWAPAAELEDQVLRQAVADVRELHRLDGLPEPRMMVRRDLAPVPEEARCRRADRCGHDACRGWSLESCRLRDVDVAVAGRWAIRHLPAIIEQTEGLSPRDPRRVAAAAAEKHLRVAVMRCEVLLGVRLPAVRLDRMRNADYGRYIGPWCETPAAANWRPPECQHWTCARAWRARHVEWAVPWCPHCGIAGLRIDPTTEETYCSTRGCVDSATGRRPSWSREELAAWWTE